jgi:hypothetical protein
MHIHDFYNKFTASDEECHLFQALRSLSLAEDLKSALTLDGDGSLGEWLTWPPSEPPVGFTASAGI